MKAGLIFLCLLAIHLSPLNSAPLETGYHLDLQLLERQHLIRGTETITLKNNTALPIDTVRLHLTPNHFRAPQSPHFQRSENLLEELTYLTVWDIKADDKPCAYRQAKQASMDFILPEPLRSGDSVKVTLQFETKIPQGHHYQCASRGKNSYRLIHFYPVIEPFTESGWQSPQSDEVTPDKRHSSLYQVRIVLPERYQIVAALPLGMRDTLSSGQIRHTFRAQKLKQLSMVVTTGSFHQSFGHSHTTVDLLIGHPPARSTNLKRITMQQLVSDILTFYENFFAPYPHPQLSLTVAPIPGGYTADNFILMERNRLEGATRLEYSSVYLLAQLLARQYFEYYIYSDPDHSEWLNKGLINFCAAKYMNQRYPRLKKQYHVTESPKSRYYKLFLRLATLSIEREQFGQPLYMPTRSADLSDFSEQITYFKGQKVVEMLEYGLGDSLFRLSLQQFLQQYRYNSITDRDFFDTIERISGKDLTQFYHIWVASDDIPDLKLRKVKRFYNREDRKHHTTIITQGAPLKALPVDLNAVTSAKDTIIQTIHTSSQRDTLQLLTDRRIQKVLLDPHNKIWDLNRLNNNYPHKVYTSFLIGMPSIEAYQIFYYPTFDFNNRDLARVGIKVRGRYWINMRPLFPAQSLDEWSLGINYGLKSETVGYDVSYSTSLLALLFQPRIDIRSRDYFGLNETRISSEIYLGQIKYPLLHQIQGYKKLTLGMRYEKVRTLAFLNANNWQRGTLLNPFIDFVNFHNWGNYRHILRWKIGFGAPWLTADYRFVKISLDGQLKLRTTKHSWIYQRLFWGISTGDLPRQQLFYFFGKNIFENLSFASYRLVKGAGDMRGYGATSPKGRNILTMNTEARWSIADFDPAVFDLILFFDNGMVVSDFSRISLPEFRQDAGIGIEFNALEALMVGIHFPLWVSHPVDNKSPLALRWVLAFDLSL